MDDELLREFLSESWENLSRLDTEIVELERKPNDQPLLASIFRTIHTIKGSCGFVGLTALGAVAHSAESALGQMREGRLQVTPAAISIILEAVDAIKLLLRGVEETQKEPVVNNTRLIHKLNLLADLGEPIPAAPPAIPVQAQVSPAPAPEVVATPVPAPESQPVAEAAPAPEAAEPEARAELPEGSTKSVVDLSIRVNVDVVDRLMNLVGELVLTRNQLLQMVRGEDESKYAAPITHLNRVTTDLQEGVMKTRMQPIGNAWSKLPRLVRDLGQTTGKQIDLEMVGAETELDRTVLDAIKDPLTHMVRNSADHGIESATMRRAAGKPEIGKVRLNAYHEGGHVIICIEDDGGGLPVEKIRQKAVKNGLVAERDAARLSDKDVLQFIFLPGFSTAEKVTSVSGRGVGMDVVKTQIERIGGVVDLFSKPGQGTTVRIKIPLTLAIISALVVESGGLTFAIPQLGVVELVRLAADDKTRIERIHQQEVFRLRKRLLPLVHLDQVLGLQKITRTDRLEDVNIVVVQVGDEQFGLIVAEVFDTEEIVVKPVGTLLKHVNIYQGTTILGDGKVIMILDVAGIAQRCGGLNSSNSERENQRAEHDADKAATTSLLMFDAGGNDGQPTLMAVPLSLVARLEEIPRSQIERSGDKLVVQYRGNLLPLLPIAGVRDSNPPDPQPVIVFAEGNRSMGLLVHQIQDIIEETLIIRIQSQRQGVLGTAIIGERATEIIDTNHYVTTAFPEWFNDSRSYQQPRVLVVDDSIFFRQLLTTALESEGYKVRAADGAQAALSLLEHDEKFDLIVSDLEMPGMDGFQFARLVRQRAGATPMLALSSLSSGNVEAKTKQAGFNRYMPKFNARLFLTAVEELTARDELEQSA